jgi:hypothetical protein
MAGNDPPVPRLAAGAAPDTLGTMAQAQPVPLPIPRPPGEPAWDITFTRLAQAVQPGVEACALDLARRLEAIGVGSEMQVRQTPRGLSTFLALLGRRGLIGLVDMTLVDGMAVGHGPCATLDIRLLDACGDAVADGLTVSVLDRSLHGAAALQALQAHMARAATAVYVETLAHFDLLQPARAGPGRA